MPQSLYLWSGQICNSTCVQGCPRVKGVYIREALRIVPASSSRRRRQASYCSVSESRFRFYATLCFLASIHFLLEVSCPCSWGVGEHQPLAPGSQTKQVWPRPPQTESRSRERSDPVVVEQERNLVHWGQHQKTADEPRVSKTVSKVLRILPGVM